MGRVGSLGATLPIFLGRSNVLSLYGGAMFQTSLIPLRPFAALAFGLVLASGQHQPPSKASEVADEEARAVGSVGDILATVNNMPISQVDVRLAMRNVAHDTDLPPAHVKNVLETIIRRELLAQRAIELGLDANPTFQQKLRRMEAQINDFRRRELSELLRREIARTTEVSEEEAKDYFAKNAARFGTELHVWQILRRDERQIKQALNDLKGGASFEEVARKAFPNLPKSSGEPWNLGYLRWNQVPESWRSVVEHLEEGEVSGVIRGPNRRFWIIRLVDRRENPEITFESAKPLIVETLKNAKIEQRCENADRELRAKAKIVYLKAPVGLSEE